MKRISEFVMLFTLLVWAACGGSGAADKTRPGAKPEAGQETAGLRDGGELAIVAKSASAADPADFLRLGAVRLGPANINAAVDISAEALVLPPVPEVIEFEYRWFVNNSEVAGATGPTLKSGNFRKCQWIFCQARALAGGKVSGWLKSNWVRIANSPPQLESIAVDNFAVPGQFRYQVTASDIDDDELIYKLIAPLDTGIELNKKSGLLTWNLDDKIVEKLGGAIIISFSVSDNDANPTTGSLTLRFQK